MYKYFSSLLIILISLRVVAQNVAQDWKAYPAFDQFTSITASDSQVFVASKASVFMYDISDKKTISYTTINGLSGDEISTILFSEAHQMLLIGYTNGRLELLNPYNSRVTQVVDILNQSQILTEQKHIYDFAIEGDHLYIATGFGVIEYNLDSGFFGETYRIADTMPVNSIAVQDEELFLSISNDGTYRADTRDDLHINSNWHKLQDDVFTQLLIFNDQVVGHTGGNQLYLFNENTFVPSIDLGDTILDISTQGVELCVTKNSSIELLQSILSRGTVYNHSRTIDLAIYYEDQFYVADQGNGFFTGDTIDIESQTSIEPAGPLGDYCYGVAAYDGELWLTHGSVSNRFSANDISRTGISHSDQGNWSNVTNETIFGIADICNVTINPNDKEHVLFSAFYGGLLEYKDEEFSLYNRDNSNIEADFGFGDGSYEPTSIDKVFTATFDQNNAIWISNNRTFNPLKKLEVQDENQDGLTVNVRGLITEQSANIKFNFWDLVVDIDNRLYVATYNNGLIAYDINTRQLVNIDHEGLGINDDLSVRTLALDQNNELWIGTAGGLRRFTNPRVIFEQGTAAQASDIIFESDGIAQQLFSQQVITDIVVDADNNKWVATSDSGVFYISGDGQETVHNFTKENSPLPSNVISQISIDPVRGDVFFATENGLVSFNGKITEANSDLNTVKVFPNPVRPEYDEVTVTIQGLTLGANVKITDIEGNLVFEAQNDTFSFGGSGTIFWDTRSFDGREVASGVYMILVTSEDQTITTVEKLLIVR